MFPARCGLKIIIKYNNTAKSKEECHLNLQEKSKVVLFKILSLHARVRHFAENLPSVSNFLSSFCVLENIFIHFAYHREGLVGGFYYVDNCRSAQTLRSLLNPWNNVGVC